MDIITCDLETYYSQEYSLTKLTTEQYVRDPRFETILVGLALNNEKPTWFSGDDKSVRSYLHERISPDSVLIAHNAAFDAAILSWRYDVRPGLIMDTVSMGRALVGEQSGASLAKLAGFFGFGQKGTEVLQAKGKRRADFSVTELEQYARYCMNDVVLCRALAHKMLETFPESELEIVDMTMRMFTEPALVLNRPLLEAYLKRVVERREKLLADAGVSRELLMSNDKLATVLQALDVDPPRKVSARTGKEAWAFAKTDEAFVALADHDDEMVSAIVSARLGVKSTQEETRIQFFMDIADRGTLPIALKYSGAGTHRYSGSDKQNIQNLPARDDAKKDLKRSIRAPDGMVVVSADSSQIEARLTPYFCGQQDLVDIFASGRDPYCEFASTAYNRVITKADKAERFTGKTCILGLGYGTGKDKLQGTLKQQGKVDIPINEAQRLVDLYRNLYPKIPQMWNHLNRVIHAMMKGQYMRVDDRDLIRIVPDGLMGPTGLVMNYPKLHTRKGEDGRDEIVYWSERKRSYQYIYGAKLLENIIQHLARCVIAEQMVRINERYKVLFQVHDEIVLLAPESEADEALQFVMDVMRRAPAWAPGLPVNCEAGYADNYGDA